MKTKGLLKTTKRLCAVALVASSLGLELAAMPQTDHASSIAFPNKEAVDMMKNYNSPAMMESLLRIQRLTMRTS